MPIGVLIGLLVSTVIGVSLWGAYGLSCVWVYSVPVAVFGIFVYASQRIDGWHISSLWRS